MEFNDKKLTDNVDNFKTRLLEIGLNPTQIAAVLKLRAEEAFQANEKLLAIRAKTRERTRRCRARSATCSATVALQEKPQQNQQSGSATNGHIYNYSKKESKKDIYSSCSATDADFEEFYKLYPRHTAPRKAKLAYLKARKEGASKEEILQGVANLKASNRELQYVPYPATWLNQQCWRDDPAHISPKSAAKKRPSDLASIF